MQAGLRVQKAVNRQIVGIGQVRKNIRISKDELDVEVRFHEATLILIPKPDKDPIIKQNYR